MSITLSIDYGNGAMKSFCGVPYMAITLPRQPKDAPHVHDALEQAANTAPGLRYAIETHWLGAEGATNRAGLVTLAITEIDGIQGPWAVSVNGETVELRKQMAGLDILPSKSGELADGDEVVIAAPAAELR